MISDQEIEFEGKVYFWSYDETVESPQRCWSWIGENFMSAPEGLVVTLNRRLIDNIAADVVVDLEPEELSRYCKILDAMGANDEDLVAVGLESEIYKAFPDRKPSRFVTEMPDASHLPFNSPVVRDWFFGNAPAPAAFPMIVSCIGETPFTSSDFTQFLRSRNVHALQMNEHIQVLILGRDNWTEEEIDEAIDSRLGQTLKIYSQEMFMAYLASGIDPFHSTNEVLEAFKAGHEGLEFVSTGWTGWVTTYVNHDYRTGSSQRFDSIDWIKESPIHAMGYKVGKSGLPVTERRRILHKAFTQELPIVGPHSYMSSWGEPKSAKRLEKMAETIASNCRNQRSRRKPPMEAISDWESDLEWLKEEFYHGHFRFYWPSIYV